MGKMEGKKKEEQPKQDIDKLQGEVNNVYKSLRFIRAVVDQEKFQIVPNTATVVLDTVMDVFTLQNNFFMNQDSTTLLSQHNNVCQCLAQFIKWADEIQLHGSNVLNKDHAHKIISSLTEGMEELTKICVDKLEHRKNSAPKSPNAGSGSYSQCSDDPKRSSLPDIPLTPREREILEKTSDLGIYDNSQVQVPLSRSTDSLSNILNNNNHNHMAYEQDIPPPKPPLPANIESVLPKILQRHSQEIEAVQHPPPLPQKQRSGTSILDTSSSSPYQSLSPLNQSPHTSMVISSPNNDGSYYSDHMSSFSQSPSISPISKSPASSFGSGLNHSVEDLPSGTQRTQRASSFSRTSSDSKMLQPIVAMTSSHSECTVHKINELTQEINRLTSDIAKKTNGDYPPPLPTKMKMQRLPSQYDNIEMPLIEMSTPSSQSTMSKAIISQTVTARSSQMTHSEEARLSSSSASSTQSFTGMQMQKSNTISFTQRTSSQETYSSSDTFSSTSHSSMESLPRPPPLPPKQRHIQAYMQTFGAYTQPQGLEYISRHSINFYEAQWHRHQLELSHQMYPRSNTISTISDFSSDSSFGDSAPNSPAIPALPAKRKFATNRESQVSTGSSHSDTSADVMREKASSLVEPGQGANSDKEVKRSSAPAGQVVELPKEPHGEPEPSSDIQKDVDSDFAELNPLDDIDVSDQLIRKKQGEDGPEIRGGSVDALIVHAAAAAKSEFMYQEAFLTTYRTFITPKELIDKVLYRFHKFRHHQDARQKAARNAFSLLIRIIDLMSSSELEDSVIQQMMDLVFELLCQGELMLARILRRKIIEKCEIKRHQKEQALQVTILSSISLVSNPPDLLHFKSSEIAEQMTHLDAELFQKIEIPEVLMWAKEQSEEKSPNLTEFTEHFNKMSYWCRTRILLQEEAKDREKYMMKFIKIMRHLRKMSNFNSYLAILSALDSAPIRRLEWQRQNLEALREFCHLIDSSASFRAYRLALAETEPPSIPYIGLILQDLTFINIGNPDTLTDGSINFAKRWQQFHILDSMRRFRDKKHNYEVKRNDRILAMFNYFDDYLSEEVLWQISEKIKPRGGKKKADGD
ncbi:hypothetical protein CHS0354_008138 [Potamilus streckersoni]|uniref:CRK SH3-binding GNRP n=1 Tax=Potamilus streckersoni TaxID=2493646 RepID=A0AAE0SZM6_9BIVA|nr:hypothetical protein CHS0354_008138 [Potamilus streckersoni]